MNNTTPESTRIDVWVAMADHFLDTETRQNIPLTALRCLEAGLTLRQARHVWCYEVSPAVWPNAWDPTGEWLGWDPEWLVPTIDRLRRRWENRPGSGRWLRYRIRVLLVHGVWRAIGRTMRLLQRAGTREEQQQMAMDLEALAQHYLDFCPEDFRERDGAAIARLRALYPTPFVWALRPAVFLWERLWAHRRVRAALKAATP